MKVIHSDDKHRSAGQRSWIIEDDHRQGSPLRTLTNDGDPVTGCNEVDDMHALDTIGNRGFAPYRSFTSMKNYAYRKHVLDCRSAVEGSVTMDRDPIG